MVECASLPSLDVPLSRLGFGAEPLGGTDWGHVDESTAIAAVGHALDLGINFFDTADVYGLGRSERLLSQALGSRRHDVVIATKFGVNWTADAGGRRAKTFLDSSPKHVFEAVDASLRRLRIDSIPLYFVHWPDPGTPIAETLDALTRCREQGKIKAVGLSNFSLGQFREATQYMKIDAVQAPYNLVDRHIETEFLACCRELHICVITYGSLAQGLLTGKYSAPVEFEPNDRRHRLTHFQSENLQKNLKIVERLKRISTQYGKTPAQIAIRWVLDNSKVDIALTGVKSPSQIEHNFGALGWQLTPSDYRQLSMESDKLQRGLT